MSVNVQSNAFTDANVLFADKEAANIWRLSLTVPDATATTPGVVYKGAVSVASFPSNITTPYYNITTVEGDSAIVASKAVTDNYKAQIDYLNARLEALITVLKNIGVLS